MRSGGTAFSGKEGLQSDTVKTMGTESWAGAVGGPGPVPWLTLLLLRADSPDSDGDPGKEKQRTKASPSSTAAVAPEAWGPPPVCDIGAGEEALGVAG